MGSTLEVAHACTVCRLPAALGRVLRALLGVLYCSYRIHFLCTLIDILGTSNIMHRHGKAVCEEPR